MPSTNWSVQISPYIIQPPILDCPVFFSLMLNLVIGKHLGMQRYSGPTVRYVLRFVGYGNGTVSVSLFKKKKTSPFQFIWRNGELFGMRKGANIFGCKCILTILPPKHPPMDYISWNSQKQWSCFCSTFTRNSPPSLLSVRLSRLSNTFSHTHSLVDKLYWTKI